MRATIFVDVLSHYCLAALPAARALAELTPHVELVLAPRKGGEPAGYTNEQMRWYYKRGAMAYGREMRADWCEGPQTRTFFANAAAYAGGEITGDRLRVVHAVASAALDSGRLLGRADECYEFVGKYCGVPASEIAKRVADPAVRAALDEGNRRMEVLGVDEVPTFLIESDIGDRVLLKGLWHKELAVAAGLATLHDERAYRTAGPPPF